MEVSLNGCCVSILAQVLSNLVLSVIALDISRKLTPIFGKKNPKRQSLSTAAQANSIKSRLVRNFHHQTRTISSEYRISMSVATPEVCKSSLLEGNQAAFGSLSRSRSGNTAQVNPSLTYSAKVFSGRGAVV